MLNNPDWRDLDALNQLSEGHLTLAQFRKEINDLIDAYGETALLRVYSRKEYSSGCYVTLFQLAKNDLPLNT